MDLNLEVQLSSTFVPMEICDSVVTSIVIYTLVLILITDPKETATIGGQGHSINKKSHKNTRF
jgi:hypothetical protein